MGLKPKFVIQVSDLKSEPSGAHERVVGVCNSAHCCLAMDVNVSRCKTELSQFNHSV